MSSESFKCPICEYENTDLNSMRIHCQKKHGTSSRDLYLSLFTDDGKPPMCVCGCGEETKFKTLQLGFNNIIKGHNARIDNPYTRPEIQERSQVTRRKMWKNGELKTWVEGKTKESDERIAAMGKKISKTLRANNLERARRSKRMRENRLNGTIPTLYGEKSSQWQGGTSAIQSFVRSTLYNDWIFPILQKSNFRCQRCNATTKLCVHHDSETFSSILRKAMTQFNIDSFANISHEFKTHIANWVRSYHINNNVSGITLCQTCHREEHDRLNMHP